MKAQHVPVVVPVLMPSLLIPSHALQAQWTQLNRPMADFRTLAISGLRIYGWLWGKVVLLRRWR
jgi:hypothetical protein